MVSLQVGETMNMWMKIILAIAVVIIALFTLGLVGLRMVFPPVLSPRATEQDFYKNYETIMAVTNFMVQSDHDFINLDSTYESGVMSVRSDQPIQQAGHKDFYPIIEIEIDDPDVIKAIDILLQKAGYNVITKKGNTIHFQRSARLMDFSSGVAFSVDGSEPELTYRTQLDPLSKEGWHYYEEDFNEFKRLQESDSK